MSIGLREEAMATRTRWLVLTVLAALLAPVAAAAGEVREDQQAPSPALGRPLPYTIYLPDGHDVPGARFPVLYVMHGYGGGQREWFRGGLAEALDRLIASGAIRPVIAVAPEAGRSWYVDSARFGGPGDYETAIAADLVAHVERTWPALPGRAFRAMAGNSMGGHGALRLAFAYPDRYGQVAALSPAIWRPGGVSWGLSPQILRPEGLEQWFPRTTGETFDWRVFRAQSPFALVARMAAMSDPPRVLLGVGDDDYFGLQDGTVEMYLELRAHGLRPELRVLDGGHDWRLWGRMLDDVLEFLDQGWPAL